MDKDAQTTEDMEINIRLNDTFVSKQHLSVRQAFKNKYSRDTVTLDIRCWCPEDINKHQLTLDYNALMLWLEGTLVQRAFPDLNDNARELLVTGYCVVCWEDLFSAEEKDQLL